VDGRHEPVDAGRAGARGVRRIGRRRAGADRTRARWRSRTVGRARLCQPGGRARAATTLRGHARPTGDTGDWPLDDTRVAQFAEAVKIRRKVTGAAQLYRGLLLLSTIALVIILIEAVGAALFGGWGSGGPWANAVMFGMAGFLGGFCALYYFASRATMRAKRWAPLTMLILFVLAVAMNLLSIAVAASGRPEQMVSGIIVTILAAIFAVVSWNSCAAIPRWRAQPAWCQELIVKSGQ
jgi:hypothetical protein